MEDLWRFTGDTKDTDYGTVYRIQSNKEVDLKRGHVLIRELGGYIDSECELQDAWLDENSKVYGAEMKDGTVIIGSEVHDASLDNCHVGNSHISYNGNIKDATIINSIVKGDGTIDNGMITITGDFVNKVVKVRHGKIEVEDRVDEE